MRRTIAVLAVTTMVLLIAVPAFAHVEVSPEEAAADSEEILSFSVPHGCDGSPTVGLSIQIPAGVVAVKPQVKPGWDITIDSGTLPAPVEDEGETLTEGVTGVTWTGGPLQDEYMDIFELSVKLPDQEGETLAFPVVQTCEQGENDWIQVPAEGQTEDDVQFPAPALELVAAEESGEASEETSTDPLAVVALVVGALGLVAGGVALGKGRGKA